MLWTNASGFIVAAALALASGAHSPSPQVRIPPLHLFALSLIVLLLLPVSFLFIFQRTSRSFGSMLPDSSSWPRSPSPRVRTSSLHLVAVSLIVVLMILLLLPASYLFIFQCTSRCSGPTPPRGCARPSFRCASFLIFASSSYLLPLNLTSLIRFKFILCGCHTRCFGPTHLDSSSRLRSPSPRLHILTCLGSTNTRILFRCTCCVNTSTLIMYGSMPYIGL